MTDLISTKKDQEKELSALFIRCHDQHMKRITS